MNSELHPDQECTPKLVVWQLRDDKAAEFTTQECMLTIESMASLSKPIVVLTGPRILQRPDLFQIVQYGFALRLKMIIEAEPEELNDKLLLEYAPFGKRVFRIVLDGRVIEDPVRRFRDTPEFRKLDECLARLRRRGYEVHLAVSLTETNPRKLAYFHDYALQRAARGIFCHLDFGEMDLDDGVRAKEIDHLLGLISWIKNSMRSPMYFSPQCVTYTRRKDVQPEIDGPTARPLGRDGDWLITCAAGRTYAMIATDGTVQVCRCTPVSCGQLRDSRYDFAAIWREAPVFRKLREEDHVCGDIRRVLTGDGSFHTEKVPQ